MKPAEVAALVLAQWQMSDEVTKQPFAEQAKKDTARYEAAVEEEELQTALAAAERKMLREDKSAKKAARCEHCNHIPLLWTENSYDILTTR
jgi:hypothetical protein